MIVSLLLSKKENGAAQYRIGAATTMETARGTLAMPTRTATHQYKAGIQMETGIQTETDIQTETVIQMEMGIQTETKDRVTEVSLSNTVNAA